MSFFNRFFKWLPNPFKSFREHLQIEEQWMEFKQHMRPHKFKIYFVLIAASYPIISPYVYSAKEWAIYHVTTKMNNFLSVQKPPFQITENFAKNLLGSIFEDQNIRKEGLQFVNSIIQQQKFVDDILNLLISALKSSDFMQVYLLKRIKVTTNHLQRFSRQFQHAMQVTLVKIVNSKEVKDSFIHLIQSAFSSPESITTITNLLKKGIQSEQVKQSVSGTVNYSVQELLKDDETMNQLKIFMVFLLRKFQNDDEIKNMIDIIFAKSIGLTKKKKQNQLQKLLKEMDQKIDKNELQK